MISFIDRNPVARGADIKMKETTCAVCGATLARPDRYEDVPDDIETEREHLERTDHIPFSIPTVAACQHCGCVWGYSGDERKPTCPNCRNKTDPEADTTARIIAIDENDG